MPEREYYDELMNDVYSESDSSYQAISNTDKNTHYYPVKKYNNKKQKEVYENVKCFSSGDTGSVIRNAQFGTYYSYYLSKKSDSYILGYSPQVSTKKITHLVGSPEEDLYFKIKMPGIVKKDGTKISVTLFYNNPEQCERHLNIEFSRDLKENWKNKKIQRMLSHKNKFLFKEELEPNDVTNDHEGNCVVVK
jgi:hypothetical protein